MSIQKLIMASVATMSVYRRLAKLSDEEKKTVIDKVKEKMNIKDAPAEDARLKKPFKRNPCEETDAHLLKRQMQPRLRYSKDTSRNGTC